MASGQDGREVVERGRRAGVVGILQQEGKSIVVRQRERERFGRLTLVREERVSEIDSGGRKGSGAREVYTGGRSPGR